MTNGDYRTLEDVKRTLQWMGYFKVSSHHYQSNLAPISWCWWYGLAISRHPNTTNLQRRRSCPRLCLARGPNIARPHDSCNGGGECTQHQLPGGKGTVLKHGLQYNDFHVMYFGFGMQYESCWRLYYDSLRPYASNVRPQVSSSSRLACTRPQRIEPRLLLYTSIWGSSSIL